MINFYEPKRKQEVPFQEKVDEVLAAVWEEYNSSDSVLGNCLKKYKSVLGSSNKSEAEKAKTDTSTALRQFILEKFVKYISEMNKIVQQLLNKIRDELQKNSDS